MQNSRPFSFLVDISAADLDVVAGVVEVADGPDIDLWTKRQMSKENKELRRAVAVVPGEPTNVQICKYK